MRISATHLDTLRAAIEPLDTVTTRQTYAAGGFPRADMVRDLDERYRWDLYYAAGGWRILGDAMSDYTDDHVDTALRRIVAPLEVAR